MNIPKFQAQLESIVKTVQELLADLKASPATAESKPTIAVANVVTPEELSYTDLKKYAKAKGVSASGTREEILARLEPAAPAEEEDIPDEAAPAEDDAVSAEIEEYVKSLSQEELAELLTQAGLSAKGKQPVLVARVLEAVAKGDIEFEDDDDEEAAEEDDDDDESDDSLDDGTLADLPDFKGMTDARKAAVIDFRADILSDVKSGDFPRAEQIAWLQEYHGDKDSRKKLTDKQILTAFLIEGAKFIDNDGEIYAENLETLYEVGEDYFCCGKELAYDEAAKSFKCSVCGSEYEAE